MVPKNLKIGNMLYEVKTDEVTQARLLASGLLGEINYTNLEVSLRTDLPEQRIKSVLLHEIVHGLLYEAGSEEFNNELLIDLFSKQLTQFLMDNPESINYLLAGKE